MISANNEIYDHKKSFNKNGFIDWKQNINANVGDIVYIYCSKPIQKIMFKTKVEKINMSFNEIINDYEFWIKKEKYLEEKKYFRLKLIKFIDKQELSLSNLKENGLISPPQKAIKIKENQLLNYLSHFFSSKNREGLNKIKNEVNSIFAISNIDEKTKNYFAKTRIFQGKWRNKLLTKFNNECPITLIKNKDLLIASHIKPFSNCKNSEAYDIENGLILSFCIDTLFDKGYISFDNEGKIIFSKYLDNDIRNSLSIKKWKIYLNSNQKKYMIFHREKIFKK